MEATYGRGAKTRPIDFKLLVGPPRRLGAQASLSACFEKPQARMPALPGAGPGGANSELNRYEEIERWFSWR